ncbi:glycosyltransferase [Myroides odoratimimus]|uniref:glycosyltransferase n=1 Tax=Myroides odoratimimus TaxID=76832 RepID=UPI0009217058|nr:glycosyltransferase [Myroides odoratimimus]SHM67102.1 GalNAc-alpha-(1->4)-GalNAc-alpha-(1->3)-diNAcBac-PP-undecaprenol alpha-1,4-N-acetyl-D-galactosaminyltransferase [Myroides odoratimimus subsp. xuanwuensis]
MSNIVLIIPSLEKGGMERVMSTLANEFCKLGNRVTIICTLPNRSIEYDLDERVNVVSYKVNYKKSIIFKLKICNYLIRTLKNVPCDYVISFGERFNPMSILCARILRKPIFISDRSNPYKVFSKAIELQRRLSYPYASGMLAQTTEAKKILGNKGFNNNIEVFANPLRKINDVYVKKNKNIILSVGRLIDTKNFKELIDIFSSINNKDWELWILGDGPLRYDLEQQIKNLNLEKSVILKGKVDDVDRYMSEASIFAFTSLSEGFPNALNEAQAFPLACISYDCNTGPADLIENNVNGILISKGDFNTYKLRLYELMCSVDLRDRLTLQSVKNREKYSASKIAKSILEFINGRK